MVERKGVEGEYKNTCTNYVCLEEERIGEKRGNERVRILDKCIL